MVRMHQNQPNPTCYPNAGNKHNQREWKQHNVCPKLCYQKMFHCTTHRVKIHTISHVFGWKHVQHDKNKHLHYKIVLGKMVPTHACQYSKPTSKNYFTSNDPRCDIILSQLMTSHLDVYMAYNFWHSILAFLFWHSILTFYSVLASILIFCKRNGVRRAVFGLRKSYTSIVHATIDNVIWHVPTWLLTMRSMGPHFLIRAVCHPCAVVMQS